MKKFSIKIPEIHITKIELFAESQEQALEKAQSIYNQEHDLVSFYDHTKDPNEWEIQEIPHHITPGISSGFLRNFE